MKIKRNFFRIINMALAGILVLLGFNNCDEPRVEYGVPNADYTIKGKVLSKQGSKPIKGIRIGYSRYVSNDSPMLEYGVIPTPYRTLKADTTDVSGAYKLTEHFSIEEFYEGEIPVYVQDIDGADNGLFRDTVINVNFDNAVKTGKSKSWYMGERTIELNIELTPKEEGNE